MCQVMFPLPMMETSTVVSVCDVTSYGWPVPLSAVSPVGHFYIPNVSVIK